MRTGNSFLSRRSDEGSKLGTYLHLTPNVIFRAITPSIFIVSNIIRMFLGFQVLCYLLHAGILLLSFFSPEHRHMSFRNVG
jgi:hypothetical protein